MKLYRIRPLAWEERPNDGSSARTIFGYLHINCEDGEWSWSVWDWDEDDEGDGTECESAEDGKRQAEAHYRKRLEGALEEVTT